MTTYSVPYTFVPGTKAKANEVNANFSTVVDLIEETANNSVDVNLSNITAAGKSVIFSNSKPSRLIGEIVQSTIPLTSSDLHLLDGTLIIGGGTYSAFVDYIADLYDSGDYDDLFETEANWQASVTANGVCGKFVYDSENGTVRLPKITGFIEGTTDVTALGDLVEAGLPNITGEFGLKTDAGVWLIDSSFNGAMYRKSGGSGFNSSTPNTQGGVGFDASLSNAIYGNSNTVQPQSIKVLYYIVIATSTKTDIEADIDDITTDLNGKSDVDLSNATPAASFATALNTAGIRTVTETYVNGTSWYRIWSDGWCEQGGRLSTGSSTDTNFTVSLLKSFADTNYFAAITSNSTSNGFNQAQPNWVYSRSTSSFGAHIDACSGDIDWLAFGYIN